MKLMALGFIFGIIVAIIIIFINKGIINGRNIKNNNRKLLARDNNIYTHLSGGDGSGWSNNRYALSDEQKEKMLLVMQNLKRLTRGFERETTEEIINYIDNEGMNI